MKAILLLAAVAFVAIIAVEAEDMNNLLKREERSAIGGRRPGPNIRKKRKQSKNTAQNGKKGKKRNGKIGKKIKTKAGFMQGKSDRKVKVKSTNRQTCRDDDIANTLQKIGSWRSAMRNTINLYKNLVDKVSVNGTIKESLSTYMNDAINLIGAVTKDGTDCSDDCPAEACAAYKTLSNCSTTVPVACQIPQTVLDSKLTETEEEECFAQLDAFEQTCTSSNRTNCCAAGAVDFTQDNISKCKYTEIVRDIRQASKYCLNSTVDGTLSNCMLKVKQSASLVKPCIGEGGHGDPFNCQLNSTCSSQCSMDFNQCIDTCILRVANCSYPTPTLNETSQTCTCLQEDAKNGDYAKCDEDGCKCVPICQANDQCPGWNTTCNANSDNCGYCGKCDGDGCCIGTLYYR